RGGAGRARPARGRGRGSRWGVGWQRGPPGGPPPASLGSPDSIKSAVELFQVSIQGSVAQVDLTDPTAPVILGGISIPPPYDPKAFAVRGNFVYVVADGAHYERFDVTGEDGPSLITIDATAASGPKIVSAIPSCGQARGIEIVDDLAVVAAGTGGVAQFSLTTPAQPLLLGAQDHFLVGGVLATPDVQELRIVGRYAVMSTTVPPTPVTVTLVADLSAPGVPVL